MEQDKNYRLLRLVVSNFMKIKALDISPDRGVNRIVGPNASGKSSTLNAIRAAFGGARQIPGVPVHAGASQADILCVLGDERPELLVKRIIEPDGKTYLDITSAEGYKAPSPQAILDSLYGKIAFDPQAFLLLDEAKQVQLLRQLVGLDFTEFNTKYADLYAERTLSNTTAKRLQAQADGIVIPDDTPSEEVSVAALIAEQHSRQRHNDTCQAEHNKLKACDREIGFAAAAVSGAQDEVTRLTAQLREAERKLAKANEALTQAQTLADAQRSTVAVLQPQNVGEISQRLLDAQAINQNVAKRTRKAELLGQAQQWLDRSRDLTAQMEAIERDKQAAMENAAWPVEGLAFDADGVTYKGLPFEQASDAEKLTVSFAMGAAMSPGLKVALIRNASLIYGETMETLCRIAEERDYQVFLEIASEEDGPATVRIEDGMVLSGGNAPDTPLEIGKKPRKTRTKKVPVEVPSDTIAQTIIDDNTDPFADDVPFDTNPFME